MQQETDHRFVVLPDTSAALVVWKVLDVMGLRRVIPHASGRPWLVGQWPRDQVVTAEAGPVRLAVFGTCPVTANRLARMAAQVRTISDVDAIAKAVAGSCHLMASIDSEVRMQGSATGLRRMYYTRWQGVSVAADRADVLAMLTGATVDDQVLAARAGCMSPLPLPLGDQPMWTGIQVLPADHCLLWGQHHHSREVRWWRPPPAELPIADGAPAVRDALIAAVNDAASGQHSADLSGGLDSTSLSFLAARATPDLLTFRMAEVEAGNDDAVFATLAHSALPDVRNLVITADQCPRPFDDAGQVVDREEPFLTRIDARTRHIAALLAQHGSQRHLAGHGGDEMFIARPAYLHQLLHRQPRTALRHYLGYAAQQRWPVWPTLGELLRPGDLQAWWRTQAAHLTSPLDVRRPMLGPGLVSVRAASWLTPAGLDLFRQALRRTAKRAELLAADLAQHQTLMILRSNAVAYRMGARQFADAGLRWDLPYYDDRVAAAVLAVRAHERAGPRRYKPLLVEAMRGIVPPPILGRTTKGEFSADSEIGLRANLPTLMKLFEDSALVARGLVDPDAVRRYLITPRAVGVTTFPLLALLGCELWLRGVLASTPSLPRSFR
ncbi:asparagine synthase-related protein [Amycolatopsis thailandensis]|uniref:asparagine synthase-related protein n=1 Tax=Amycolatopsis thailandensis TaxID=589330 RepID=UPI003633DD9C